jgi:hypothetical protein
VQQYAAPHAAAAQHAAPMQAHAAKVHCANPGGAYAPGGHAPAHHVAAGKQLVNGAPGTPVQNGASGLSAPDSPDIVDLRASMDTDASKPLVSAAMQ